MNRTLTISRNFGSYLHFNPEEPYATRFQRIATVATGITGYTWVIFAVLHSAFDNTLKAWLEAPDGHLVGSADQDAETQTVGFRAYDTEGETIYATKDFHLPTGNGGPDLERFIRLLKDNQRAVIETHEEAFREPVLSVQVEDDGGGDWRVAPAVDGEIDHLRADYYDSYEDALLRAETRARRLLGDNYTARAIFSTNPHEGRRFYGFEFRAAR